MTNARKKNGVLNRLRRKSSASSMLSCALVFGQVSPALATISNTAIVNGEYQGSTIISPPSTALVEPVPAASSMDVVKSAVLNDDDGTPGLSAGDTIDYQISVTNNGNVTINSVSFTDTIIQGARTLALDAAPVLDSGDDVDPGELNVGETWTYLATYTIDQDDLDDGGDIVNRVEFEGTAPDGPIIGADDAPVALNTLTSIAVEKTAISTSYARPNQIIEWGVTVTNTGTTTLTNVDVTDTTADSVVCSISGDATVATLGPGDFESCTATYTVQPSDILNATLENTVSVEGTAGSTIVGATDTATIAREDANLVTTKVLSSGNPSPIVGELVTYEITVTNNGDAEATQITLTDDLPSGLIATANNGAVTAGTYTAADGIWAIPSLVNGASATLTLEGTVEAGQGGNVISNTVSAAVSVENDPTDDGDVLTAIFTAVPLEILAVDDTVATPIDGALALTGVVNVFDDDTLGGVAVDETLVIPTPVGTWPADFTLNSDGTIDVAAGTPSGVYELEYQICEIADPDNCSTATVTIPIDSSTPRLTGTVYYDRDDDSELDPTDDRLPDYVVQLTQNGSVVDEISTDANGEYEFTGFEPGLFDIVFRDPDTGEIVGTISGVDIGEGETILDQDLPLRLTPSPINSGLEIIKLANQNVVRLGDTISYTITVTNTLTNPYDGVYIADTLPAGTVYTPNSATVDGVASEPTINGQILEFGPLSVPGSGSFDITLSARVGQQISGSEVTNIVQAFDGDGNPLTNVARATTRLEADPVFACSTVIGKVFDDKNRNGTQDSETSPYTPEPGLPGVRLATVDGLLITTDQFGRFSVPCSAMPEANTGSNFILKLDTRTLPTGYRVTTENPRVVRVTPGKMTTMNFGAAISRVVDIELSETAFARGSAAPSASLISGIDRLVQALETEPSVLRMTYKNTGEGTQLARQRLAEVEKLIRQKLRRSQIGTDLWIETKIIN